MQRPFRRILSAAVSPTMGQQGAGVGWRFGPRGGAGWGTLGMIGTMGDGHNRRCDGHNGRNGCGHNRHSTHNGHSGLVG